MQQMPRYGALWLTLLLPVQAMGQVSVTGSPGHVSKPILVESRCPTFTWGEVQGATAYELAVKPIGQETEAAPILRQTLSGSIHSWTPSLERCLARGGQYSWSVRAVHAGGSSEWSTPNLFQVASGPSEAEFEEALRVVRSYLEGTAGVAASAGAPAETRAWPQPGSGPAVPAHALDPAAGGTELLVVGGGVEAASFAGDGSMLTGLDPAKLSVPVPVDRGGTGATESSDVLANLGAAAAADLTSHASSESAHHPATVDTTCDGVPCDGASFANVTATEGDSATAFFSTGQIEAARIDDGIARDIEVEILIRWATHCPEKIGFRYFDRLDGTVMDCATGLIWLKDASCDALDSRSVTDARGKVMELADGMCGLTDGSSPGSWRLPTMRELCGGGSPGVCFSWPCAVQEVSDSLIDPSVPGVPKLVNARGDGSWSEGDAFVGVRDDYLSSGGNDDMYWYAEVGTGRQICNPDNIFFASVWPVRSGS